MLLAHAVPAIQEAAAAASLRPYVHVFLAYAAAWIIVLLWVWRIARGLKRLDRSGAAGRGAASPPE